MKKGMMPFTWDGVKVGDRIVTVPTDGKLRYRKYITRSDTKILVQMDRKDGMEMWIRNVEDCYIDRRTPRQRFIQLFQ